MKIREEVDILRAGKIDVGRISNHEKHGIRIGRNIFRYEIRNRIDMGFLTESNQERSKGDDDNIVRSEDG